VQLEGTLDQFPLRELIEMIVYSSVAGVLEVRVGDEIGRLYFRDGLPYHAVIGESVGFEAVCLIFEQRSAQFRFVAGTTGGEETLWMDPWDLIERAEHQAMLWARVHPRIPSLNWVPMLCSTTQAEQIHISESIWPVLSAVDGQRSVTVIAEELSVAPLDVCVALVNLLDQGLITIRQPRPALLEPRSSPRPATNGFFERLIAGIPADENADPDLPAAGAADQAKLHSRAGRE